MPHENSSPSGKRPYYPPTCTRRSIPEMAALLRREVSGRETTPAAEQKTVLSDMPILVVQGFQGNIAEIGQTLSDDAPHLPQKSVVKGEKLVAMRLNEGQRAASYPGVFLLLDLRHRAYVGDGLLDSITRKLDASCAALVVILVTSLEQFYGRGSIEREHCWQYRGPASSADLATAVRLLLPLCAEMAKFREGTAPETRNVP